ncbi:unnamed protein product [Didymodactylos carnosus]|uniref:Uncharacterized protein n=1 Tax=Didymodactylos carnosus TaxID=1234261 RepID=A0A814TBV5_9BILA|nr:unnamed protein product [Didymodactylos carnosus]CAF1511990.1 unnamed protein product [Didymodactylos carnosus]CAF3923172.1 unnamed protein product [Didymodactylos carnosus]CAF4299713.1 unnamed protein product [Didymodactylos carnosus]
MILLYGLLFVCSLMIQEQYSADLPGLDQLKSGFDASKMVPGTELSPNDKSAFRLFDFSELGEEFVLKALNKTQTFQTPAVVQVTDISMRKENYCEAITESYEEFYEQ